jgi:hypothetical protein
MEPLQNLLKHPFVVSNRLAELLYKEEGVNCFTRLRSRSRGRHRFTKEEYKGLVKLFREMSTRVRTKADRLADALQTPYAHRNLRHMLEHPTINLRQMLMAAGREIGKTYYQFYDSLRGRSPLQPGEGEAIVACFRAFADEIDAALEAAKQSAKHYPFSAGRGQVSHLER